MSDKIWNKEPMKFKVGGYLRIPVSGAIARRTKVHVIGIANDEGVEVITYRWWAKHKRYWVYEAETANMLSYKIRIYDIGDKEERNKARKRSKSSKK